MPTRDRGGVYVDPSARAYIYVYLYIVANVPHIYIFRYPNAHDMHGISRHYGVKFFLKSTLPDYTLMTVLSATWLDLHTMYM